MSIINAGQPSKRVGYVFFDRGNDHEMRNFAARVRNDNRIDVHLVWSHLFNIDEMPRADAVIIQVGCRRAEQIEAAYRRVLPNAEIHYVRPDGDWYFPDAAEEDASEPQPVVSAPAASAQAAHQAAPDPATSAHQPEVGEGAAGDGAGTDAEGFRVPAGYSAAEDSTGEEAPGKD